MITKRPITWKSKILHGNLTKSTMEGYTEYIIEYIIEVMIIMAVIGGSEGRGGLQGKSSFLCSCPCRFARLDRGSHSDDEPNIYKL